MNKPLTLSLKPLFATLALTVSGVAFASTQYPATLAGHAILPAKTFIKMPDDAPTDMQVSGKFTTLSRVDRLSSIEGKSDGRPTGLSLPFKGQPVQGHSGIKVMEDGSVWLLTDNGFGNKLNSPDAALFMRQYKIDFTSGKFEPLKTIFFHDPDQVIKHHIVNEGTKMRYLTGGDFDPESFQPVKDGFWIGEEFGPYLFKIDFNGKLLSLVETKIADNLVRSPDNPQLKIRSKPDDKPTAFEVKRSKGFEGMAASPDATVLYPLLEGALFDSVSGDYEQIDGKHFLRILTFSPENGSFGEQSWQYVLDDNSYAIGDFNMIDENYGLVIERDNFEGTQDEACPSQAEDKTSCFSKPAQFKRVYKVYLPEGGGVVEKIAYIDLMAIADPNQLSRKGLVDGKFVFPFFTIENVDRWDDAHIVVGNDNNLPFSSSREPNQVDDNELILLEVKAFLEASANE